MTNEEILTAYPNARLDLIAARRAAGVTQKAVAALLNISWPYYSMIELGKIIPSAYLAEQIEKLLGINLSEEQP